MTICIIYTTTLKNNACHKLQYLTPTFVWLQKVKKILVLENAIPVLGVKLKQALYVFW